MKKVIIRGAQEGEMIHALINGNSKMFEELMSHSDARVLHIINLIRQGYSEKILSLSLMFKAIGLRSSIQKSLSDFKHLCKKGQI